MATDARPSKQGNEEVQGDEQSALSEPALPLRRGQIYWIRWEPARGSEQRGRRPGLIVQADPINASTRYPNTIAVALTTVFHGVPTHVQVEPTQTNGLSQRSYVLCEHFMTISRERLDEYIGELDSATMAQVNRALKRALALP